MVRIEEKIAVRVRGPLLATAGRSIRSEVDGMLPILGYAIFFGFPAVVFKGCAQDQARVREAQSIRFLARPLGKSGRDRDYRIYFCRFSPRI